MRRLISLAVLSVSLAALAQSVSVELVGENQLALPSYQHAGNTYVLGSKAERYFVRIRNHTARRQEVVVSVDGRDVLDGQPADWTKRGYLVDGYADVTIDGFRLSQASVAAFRFSSVANSYAARLGDARDVGVIGVAVFAERQPVRPFHSWRPPHPRAMEDAPLGAPAQSPRPSDGAGSEKKSSRPGLGTEFGEEHDSYVSSAAFTRQNSRPDSVVLLRYNDRSGLIALGIDVDGSCCRPDEQWLRANAKAFRNNGPYATPPPGWGH